MRTNDILWLIIFSVIAIIFAIATKRKELEDQISSEPLTRGEKILTWILCIADPVIAGALLYYVWKKPFPQKAKQANKISWIAAIIGIILAVYLSFSGVF